jgi:hypothetical protein
MYLHNLYPLPNIIRMIKEDGMGRVCSTHGEEEGSIEGFGGNARRKETTRKTHWQNDNIKVDPNFHVWHPVVCIQRFIYRPVDTKINFVQ